MNHPIDRWIQLETRRQMFGTSAKGLGAVALASLLKDVAPAAQPGVLGSGHFPARAKRVIWLFMAGAPSQLDTFDYKPQMREWFDKELPESIRKGQRLTTMTASQARFPIAPSKFKFPQQGQSGKPVSELFPHVGSMADELAFVHTVWTEAINHDPAHTFMNTGTTISGRPSMGAWTLYGLGSETDNLPGFVVLSSVGRAGQAQPIAARQWHSGFLPSRFQGVEFRSAGDPVLYVGNPKGVTAGRQRDIVSAVQQLNKLHNNVVDDPEIKTRISQYEMAFRMQTSVPGLVDISDEKPETLELYGTKGADGSYAANCLLARRLAERGVRFIQVYHRAWDHHGGIKNNVKTTAGEVDKATAALIKDLKDRGLLDDTLVVFGGEFGRTPMAQGNGRDHHIKGYSMFLAGGGIKGGTSYGNTDDLGYNAQDNIFEVHDFHATLLYLLGVDHKKLTVKFQGRDFRLTDVHGNVVKDLLA